MYKEATTIYIIRPYLLINPAAKATLLNVGKATT